MDKQLFLERLKDALELDPTTVVEMDDDFRDYDEWDSLARLSLIAMLDQEYNVQLESNDFKDINSIQSLFDWVLSNT